MVENILSTEYFHSGVRDANTGEVPGAWGTDLNSGDPVWNGSSGWYNSFMPQPGILVYGALTLDL